MKKATSQDVAALAGVSQATVSLILNNSSKIPSAVKRASACSLPHSSSTTTCPPAKRPARRQAPGCCWCLPPR